ncbi:MAG: cyclic nucleotide-binding domain-containing protein [Pseudomonadota bacterium]
MLSSITPEMIYLWAGYLGVAFYIGSYIGLQTGFIPGVGYLYATCNLTGASLVLISLIHEWNRASAMISVAWIIISMVGITRTFLIKRRLYFSNEEELFLKSGMPGVPREVARKILDAGNWITLEPETYLTHEGQPVDHLYFISSGTAGVFVMGNEVAELHEGFVGELNVMEAGPASAAVKTLEKTRVFCVSGEALRRMTKVDSQTSLYLETHLSTATKQKLMQANLQLSASKSV